MRFGASCGEAEAIELKAAILLYGGNKGISFASVHEPYRDQAGAPYLNSGRPITMDFLRTLAQQLGMRMPAQILPPEVLVHTPEVTAWWVPAAVRPMFFAETCDGKTLSGKLYPHPPLVFCVDGGHGLRVCALFENDRPSGVSHVAIAPYWNTGNRGEVCLGSMPRPKPAAFEALDEWVQGFFGSEFTHSNTTKLTSHPEGHLGLWRDLAGRNEFPKEWLVPAGTLEHWLCENR